MYVEHAGSTVAITGSNTSKVCYVMWAFCFDADHSMQKKPAEGQILQREKVVSSDAPSGSLYFSYSLQRIKRQQSFPFH